MNERGFLLKRYGSLLLVVFLLAFKCADLHALSHDNKTGDDCKICQLAHTQHHDDNYLAPTPITFEPQVEVFLGQAQIKSDLNILILDVCFGMYLNKAPPVA